MGGTIVTAQVNNFNIDNGVWTAIKSVSLSIGIWIIFGSVRFQDKDHVFRKIVNISEISADPRMSAVLLTGMSLGSHIVEIARAITIVSLNKTKTFYLNAYQYSGDSMEVNGYMQSIQICK